MLPLLRDFQGNGGHGSVSTTPRAPSSSHELSRPIFRPRQGFNIVSLSGAHPTDRAIHESLVVDKRECELYRRLNAVCLDDAVHALSAAERQECVAWALRDLDGIIAERGIPNELPHGLLAKMYAKHHVNPLELTLEQQRVFHAMIDRDLGGYGALNFRVKRLLDLHNDKINIYSSSRTSPSNAEYLAEWLQLPKAAAERIAAAQKVSGSRTEVWLGRSGAGIVNGLKPPADPRFSRKPVVEFEEHLPATQGSEIAVNFNVERNVLNATKAHQSSTQEVTKAPPAQRVMLEAAEIAVPRASLNAPDLPEAPPSLRGVKRDFTAIDLVEQDTPKSDHSFVLVERPEPLRVEKDEARSADDAGFGERSSAGNDNKPATKRARLFSACFGLRSDDSATYMVSSEISGSPVHKTDRSTVVLKVQANNHKKKSESTMCGLTSLIVKMGQLQRSRPTSSKVSSTG